jgi:hypothetical protein
MSMTLHWFLSTHGDAHSIVDHPKVSSVAEPVPREPDIAQFVDGRYDKLVGPLVGSAG